MEVQSDKEFYEVKSGPNCESRRINLEPTFKDQWGSHHAADSDVTNLLNLKCLLLDFR